MDSTNTGDHMDDGDTSALEIDPPRVEPTVEATSNATSSSAPETMVDENPKEVRLMNWFEAFDIPTIIKTYHPTPSLKQQVALKEFQAKTRANIELNVAVPRWKEKSSSELVKEEDVEVYTTILVHSAHHGTEYLEEWINKGKILLGLVDTANELGHRIHVVFTHRNWKERGALEIERIQKQRDKGKAAAVDYIPSCCSCSGRATRVAEAPTTRKQSVQRPPGDNTSSAPLKSYREPTGTININCHRCLKIFSASTKITDLPQQFKSLIPVVPNDHHLGPFLDFNSWCIDNKPDIEAGKGKSNSWERSNPSPLPGGTPTEATSSNNPTSKRHNIILLTEGTICYWDPIEESLLQLVKNFNRATGSPKLPGKSLDIHIVLIHSKGPFLQLKEKAKRFFAWLNDQSEMREWWQEDWKRWDAAKKLREEWRNKNAQQDVEAQSDGAMVDRLTEVVVDGDGQDGVGDTARAENQTKVTTTAGRQATISGPETSQNSGPLEAQKPTEILAPKAIKAKYRRLPDVVSLTSPWCGKNHAVNIRTTNFSDSNMNQRSEYVRILQPQRPAKYRGPVYRITKRIIMIQIFCILMAVIVWGLVQIREWSRTGRQGNGVQKLVFQSLDSPGRGY